MSKKLEKLIKRLEKAKNILQKDDIDDKIKAKLLGEMNRRKFGEADAIRHVIDRDKGDKMPKPPKTPKPLLQSEEEPMYHIHVDGKRITDHPMKLSNIIKQHGPVKQIESDGKTKLVPHDPVTKSSALDLADQLIKGLNSISGLSKANEPVLTNRPKVSGQANWTQDPATGGFHHKLHGVISTNKTPEGHYAVVHSGKTLGTYPDIGSAGAKVKEHMNWLGSFKGGPSNAKMAPTVKEEGSMDGDCDPVYKSLTPEERAEQIVMNKLAKTVGSMMPQNNLKLQPTQEEFEAAMVAQGMAVTQEQAENMQKSWDSSVTGWFQEAMKPIGSKFKSAEEEEAYWASIKVHDKSDGGAGY